MIKQLFLLIIILVFLNTQVWASVPLPVYGVAQQMDYFALIAHRSETFEDFVKRYPSTESTRQESLTFLNKIKKTQDRIPAFLLNSKKNEIILESEGITYVFTDKAVKLNSKTLPLKSDSTLEDFYHLSNRVLSLNRQPHLWDLVEPRAEAGFLMAGVIGVAVLGALAWLAYKSTTSWVKRMQYTTQLYEDDTSDADKIIDSAHPSKFECADDVPKEIDGTYEGNKVVFRFDYDDDQNLTKFETSSPQCEFEVNKSREVSTDGAKECQKFVKELPQDYVKWNSPVRSLYKPNDYLFALNVLGLRMMNAEKCCDPANKKCLKAVSDYISSGGQKGNSANSDAGVRK